MQAIRALCLVVALRYICCVNMDIFTQNKYRITMDHAMVKFQDPEYIYDLQIRNVMMNRTERAFSTFYCVKQRLSGSSFKLNIRGFKLSYNVPTDLLFQFDVKVCDMLSNNLFGAKATLKNGNATTCPIKKGCYNLEKFVLDDTKFPPLIPPNTYRLDLRYFIERKCIAEVQFTVDVKYGAF